MITRTADNSFEIAFDEETVICSYDELTQLDIELQRFFGANEHEELSNPFED